MKLTTVDGEEHHGDTILPDETGEALRVMGSGDTVAVPVDSLRSIIDGERLDLNLELQQISTRLDRLAGDNRVVRSQLKAASGHVDDAIEKSEKLEEAVDEA